MKKLILSALLCLFVLSANAQRIAVLDFNAGSGISQSDVDGISAIFNTYFSPEGYTLVERTRIDRIIDEQGFQRGRFTQDQMVRIGQLLNVSRVVVGDINYAFKQYNVDVRVVNVESATIAAKAGVTWEQGASYREMMRSLATDLANQVAILPQPTAPVEQKVYTTNGEKLGISRVEGRYVHNGQFISKKVVRSMVIQDALTTQDFATQIRLKKDKDLIISGWILLGNGIWMIPTGITLIYAGSYPTTEIAGVVLTSIGSAAIVPSVPLLSVGYVRRDRIVNDYLAAPVKQPTAEFRIQSSSDGIGFAVAW